MIFTHEEAKTKWCPFARVPLGNGEVNGNRGFDGHPSQSESLCIADGCMAWREGPDKTVWDVKGNAEYLQRGYCGLAGKP